MEPVQNNVVQDTSTWGSVKNFFIDAGNAIGRSVVWLGNQIADFAVKVFLWAKPAFVTVGEFFANQYENLKDFIAEHKTETIIAFVALGIGAIVYGVGHALCCTKPSTGTTGTTDGKTKPVKV